MGYTIVSGNKSSPVALHQTHVTVFIEMQVMRSNQRPVQDKKKEKRQLALANA